MPSSLSTTVRLAVHRFGWSGRLERAVVQNNLAAVQRLLERGADPNSRLGLARGADRTPLMLALQTRRSLEPFRRTDAGITADKDRHFYALQHNRRIMEALLAAGADPNTVVRTDPPYVHSPLTYAQHLILPPADMDQSEMALLLRFGADPNQIGTADRRPLALAAQNDAPWQTVLLLRHGAVVDAPCNNQDPRTALWWAVDGGHPATVRVLLGAGADPNWDRLCATAVPQCSSGLRAELDRAELVRGVSAAPQQAAGSTGRRRVL